MQTLTLAHATGSVKEMRLADTDLARWAVGARHGDAAAFEKLVRCTARVVYAQVAASVRDRQKAEDLTQETFIAAWKAIGSLRQEEGVLSWLLTLARNKVLDAVKFESRQKRGGSATGSGGTKTDIPPTGTGDAGGGAEIERGRQGEGEPRRVMAGGAASGGGREVAPVEEVADRGPSPDQAALRGEAQARALQVLAELPEEYRQPLTMRYLGGADYQAICAALEISDGALRGLLNRGMAILRERMSAE